MQMTGPKSRRGVEQYARNPFWSSTKIETRGKRITVERGAYINQDGERIEAGGIHTVEKIDREQFVKLYTGHMKAIFELKPAALKVLQYLISEIQATPNADAVIMGWFSAERYFSEQDVKLSRRSFLRAMTELLEKDFIAESDKPGLFWINPNYFWNGDRYRFVREYILES